MDVNVILCGGIISLYTTVLEFSRTAVATETVLELLIGLHDCLFCQRLVAVLQMDLVKHTGGCHCGAVRFEVLSSPDLHVFQCKRCSTLSGSRYCPQRHSGDVLWGEVGRKHASSQEHQRYV
ncbi:hypothetical protein CgunFtcFv8_003251 [Champsocephalus gunnari]|uniref:Uncharacterized protein n=1 Tax=Champsocephalus gunnari TaxID=52237 RepID=A0AAN8HNJ5_CHAGU|nr:hypothetical protein CgunFtcFv8_003251 [Champsocephalus gunnari]